MGVPLPPCMMIRIALLSVIIAVIVAACGSAPPSYDGVVDQCTCLAADGGSLTVPVSFNYEECSVPPEKVVVDCEASAVLFLAPTMADAGCASQMACPCRAVPPHPGNCI